MARQIYALARTADPTTVREEAAPGDDKQRPGDVVSNAFLLGRRTAVDVGICSQDSTRPGDPAVHYAVAKRRKYQGVIERCYSREGIAFRAAIFTQEGRPGNDARDILDGLANAVTSGGTDGRMKRVRKRLAHEVTVQIQARLAKMIHACLQPPRGDAARVIFGGDVGGDDDEEEEYDETQRQTGPGTTARAAGA